VKKILISIIILGFLALGYTFVEPYWLQITKTTVISKDIPDSFSNMKIVFISDIHHGPYFSLNRVKNLVKKINAMNPDIILLGGDYVSQDSKYIEPCFLELKKLKAKIGKYAVRGNHDNWESTDLTKKYMKEADIIDLNNQAVWIKNGVERIKIAGVGDVFTDVQDINPAIFDVKEEDFVLLLSHNPDFVEEIKTKKIDLVLSGNTHGGQVTLFGLWAPIIPSKFGQKYRTGMIETEYTRVLVSKGVGTFGLPMRFFSRPEINLIRIIKGNSLLEDAKKRW